MPESDLKRPPEFWAPRRCFLTPILEIDVATDLIDAAANEFVKENREQAEELIAEADLPEICEFVQRIIGPNDHEIHRPREVPDAPEAAVHRAKERMPSTRIERMVFERDGWRCRFCGIRIVAKQAIKVLDRVFPNVVRWSQTRDAGKHCAFRALCCSLDHLVPHSRGGDNALDNLVAACSPCQFGRNQWTIEEVGISDPRLRQPVVDSWDGLMRICRICK